MVANVELSDGTLIPQLGVGTYKVPAEETERVVSTALELGYRHVDTATMYHNEREVGLALAHSGLSRDDVFVTTKLDNPFHEPAAAREAIERSLEELGLDAVDLYLIHWPMPRTTNYVATWESLVAFKEEGLAREIGVSNFTEEHLRAVIDVTGVVRAVNQVEINPYFTQDPLRAFHRERGIVTEAWSPLARGRVLDDPVITRVADEAGATPAQVVVRWHLQRGDVVFPKSMSAERLAENLAAADVELSQAEMDAISGLNRDERTGSGPDDVELPQ